MFIVIPFPIFSATQFHEMLEIQIYKLFKMPGTSQIISLSVAHCDGGKGLRKSALALGLEENNAYAVCQVNFFSMQKS